MEQQYKKSEGSIPEFLDNSGIFPNERQHVTETKLGSLMLKSQVIKRKCRIFLLVSSLLRIFSALGNS